MPRGIAKQSALAGTILFTLRSGAETVAMLGGDATRYRETISLGRSYYLYPAIGR